MATTTEALVQHEVNGRLTLMTVQLDQLKDDEVLVEIHASGICHTDLSCMNGTLPAGAPNVLGHEGAGVVVRTGKAVQDVTSGDKVLLSFNHCGSCAECQAGHPAYCHSLVPLNFGGTRLDGSHTMSLQTGGGLHSNFFGQSSFAALAIANAASVVKVAPDTPLDLFAPLGCGLQTGAGAVFNTLDVAEGGSLVVWGAGAVGLSGIMAGKIRGANPIVAVDVLDSRLELAKNLGATHVVDGRDPDIVQKVQALCKPNGARYAVDATGNPRVVENMIQSLGSRGKAATVGAPSPGVCAGLDIFQHLIMGKSYLGCCEGDAVPKDMIPYLIDQHSKGMFPLEDFITYYNIKDYEKAFEDVKTGKTVKAVLRWV